MKFLGMGVPELLIILVVVLLIFGPKHLPKLGSAVGATVKNLREGLASDALEDEDEEVVDMEEDEEASSKKTLKAATVKKAKSDSSDEA